MANRPSSKRGPIPDIRLMVSFFDHPKIKRLHKELGAEGILSLIRLWLWAAINRPLGELENMTADDIGVVAQWPDSAKFLRTLKKIGLIEKNPEKSHYKIHNWEKHQPWVYNGPVRSEIGRIAAQAKWDKRRNEIGDANSENGHCSDDERALPNDKNSNAPIHSSSSRPIGQNSSSSLPATSREEQDLSATHSFQENQEEDSESANIPQTVDQFMRESCQRFIENQDNPSRLAWPKLDQALRETENLNTQQYASVLQRVFKGIVTRNKQKLFSWLGPRLTEQNIDAVIAQAWPTLAAKVRAGNSNEDGAWNGFDYSINLWRGWLARELPPVMNQILDRHDALAQNTKCGHAAGQ